MYYFYLTISKFQCFSTYICVYLNLLNIYNTLIDLHLNIKKAFSGAWPIDDKLFSELYFLIKQTSKQFWFCHFPLCFSASNTKAAQRSWPPGCGSFGPQLLKSSGLPSDHSHPYPPLLWRHKLENSDQTVLLLISFVSESFREPSFNFSF